MSDRGPVQKFELLFFRQRRCSREVDWLSQLVLQETRGPTRVITLERRFLTSPTTLPYHPVPPPTPHVFCRDLVELIKCKQSNTRNHSVLPSVSVPQTTVDLPGPFVPTFPQKRVPVTTIPSRKFDFTQKKVRKTPFRSKRKVFERRQK